MQVALLHGSGLDAGHEAGFGEAVVVNRQVLDSMSTARLRRWLVDPRERATRLRQSMPLAFLRAADEETGSTRGDREFVRLLLRERLVNPNRLVRLINLLPLPDDQRATLREWVDGTDKELALGRAKRRPK